MTIVVGNILTGFGLFKLALIVKDPAHIYFGIGALSICFGLFCIVGIKDVIIEPSEI